MNMLNIISYEDALSATRELASAGQMLEALEQIVDPGTGRLKGIFRKNGNHSWYVVGDYYWKLGLIEGAMRAFRKSLRAWESDTQAMWALGNCYTELKKPKLAERYFRRALELEQSNSSIRFNLGNSLFDQEKFKDAISEYKVVIKDSKDLSKAARRNIRLAENRLKQSGKE